MPFRSAVPFVWFFRSEIAISVASWRVFRMRGHLTGSRVFPEESKKRPSINPLLTRHDPRPIRASNSSAA